MKEKELVAFLKTQEERKKKLAERYDKLLAELEEAKGNTQSYAKDSVIEIPGPLFSSFINFVNHNKSILEDIETSINSFTKNMSNVIDVALTDNAELTIELIAQHLEQVKAGKTVDNKVVDREKIKEVGSNE